MLKPRPFKPVVATANTLATGQVVFLSRAGVWTPDLSAAAPADTPEAAAALQAAGDRAIAQNEIVDLALVPVARDGDALRLVDLRERIRATGPTIATPA